MSAAAATVRSPPHASPATHGGCRGSGGEGRPGARGAGGGRGGHALPRSERTGSGRGDRGRRPAAGRGDQAARAGCDRRRADDARRCQDGRCGAGARHPGVGDVAPSGDRGGRGGLLPVAEGTGRPAGGRRGRHTSVARDGEPRQGRSRCTAAAAAWVSRSSRPTSPRRSHAAALPSSSTPTPCSATSRRRWARLPATTPNPSTRSPTRRRSATNSVPSSSGERSGGTRASVDVLLPPSPEEAARLGPDELRLVTDAAAGIADTVVVHLPRALDPDDDRRCGDRRSTARGPHPRRGVVPRHVTRDRGVLAPPSRGPTSRSS